MLPAMYRLLRLLALWQCNSRYAELIPAGRPFSPDAQRCKGSSHSSLVQVVVPSLGEPALHGRRILWRSHRLRGWGRHTTC